MASRLTGMPVAYHVHAAPRGENGPIVIDLVGAETHRFVFGRTVFLVFEGIVADPNGDILAAMLAGMTYVNVHTAANPGGEIRGQLFRASR